ncbi:AAA family ATPase [Streptomyces sp. NPDC002888]|uniref:AAA family ATPase n=1 Tax=Streptomyces sp. NPDC002888 TaxID=3364668 RepID=UPI0036C93E5A
MTPDDSLLAWPPWPRADERGLVRHVTARAARWLSLDIAPFDLSDRPDRCREVAAAIYDSLCRRNIRYALEPYHPSDALQTIRRPPEVLVSPREGTCLDLAALYCGLCLAHELLPVLVVVEGHAFAMVSTTHGLRDWNAYDRPGRALFEAGPVGDAAALRELVDSGSYLAVECTGFAHSNLLAPGSDLPEARHREDGLLTFDRAVAAGREQLNRPERPLRFAVDVGLAQYGWRFEPHPLEAFPGAYGTDIFRVLAQAQGPLARELQALDVEAYVLDHTRAFVGRDFVFQAVDQLVADPGFRSGYILIRGEPGIGKTSLLSQLVRTRGYVHHFNMAQGRVDSTRAFLANVCAQLIIRYELDHTFLPPEATTDSAFLSRLLAEASAKAGDQAVVVLIDALDEAEDETLAPRANRLFLPKVLPDNVFFVLTSREQIGYQLVVNRREDIYLRDDDPRNLDDVRTYVSHYLATHPDMAPRVAASGLSAEEFLEIITDKSQGNFMYLVFVLDDIRTGRIVVETMDDVRNLPTGLLAYYDQHWKAMRAHDTARFESVYEPVLRILATVREPVALPAVEEWTGVEPARIRDVLRDWRPFLNETHTEAGEPLYRVYHTSFQDFLAEEGVGLRPYHKKIAMTALSKIPGFTWGGATPPGSA